MIARTRGVLALFFATALPACGGPPTGTAERRVLVLAAVSVQTSLDEVIPLVQRAHGITVVASYGASSAMARQIEQGAPADLFVSADREWMTYVSERGLVEQSSIVDWLGNALVVIAPAGRSADLRLEDEASWQSALGDGRLAIADPSGVPAGRYARQALTALGLWAALESRLAPGENVRAALQLVARGEAPLGIVYATDAMAESRVVTINTLPSHTHNPIVYPIALRPNASADARTVLTFLRGAEARPIFERGGFRVLQ